MAKKSSKTPRRTSPSKTHGVINGAGEVVEQPIVSTIRENYMPYAMSVILSRAIPEIDGFKPSHRKLLYMMYKMGLLNGGRTKSANIVGATMKLNPHGDSAIYDTMVRLSRGYEALLHPYVDSKGNFVPIPMLPCHCFPAMVMAEADRVRRPMEPSTPSSPATPLWVSPSLSR